MDDVDAVQAQIGRNMLDAGDGAFGRRVGQSTGLLLKGLISVAFPVGAALIYLLVTGQLTERRTWQLLHVLTGMLVLVAIAAPWHVLALAGAAFALGAAGAWRRKAGHAYTVAMMIVFFHAARLALVAFDPYMGSRPLAEALNRAPAGTLIVDDQYYTFSSVFFYTNRRALLLNGRVNNLEYGSNAPDAPRDVFIDDAGFTRLWTGAARYYLVAEGPARPRLEKLLGAGSLHVVKASGGKYLFTNR
jgi:hypothetical protein